MNFLKKFDSFGVVYNLNVNNYDKQYRSTLGGLVTISVYILTLIYFIYKIMLWQTGQLIPKISSQQSLIDYFDVQFKDTFPIILSALSSGFDPFDQTNAILICQIGYYTGVEYNSVGVLLPSEKLSDSESSTLKPPGVKMVLNLGDKTVNKPLDNIQPVIAIQFCVQDIADSANITCASKEYSNYYAAKLRIFLFRLQMQQYNPETLKLENISKQIYLNFDYFAPTFYQVTYKTTYQKVDNNLFYQNFDTSTYFSDVTLICQPISQIQMLVQYNIPYQNGLGIILLRIDSNSIKQNIIYPKLGEILADIGSIMTTLLSLGIVIMIINNHLLEDELFFNVISFYFPEYKQYDIQRNLLGQIKQVTIKGKNQDLNQFNIHYEMLKQKARDKFTINNQLYELSRIQFILMTIVNRQTILDSHKMGIKIKLSQQEYEDSFAHKLIQPREDLTMDDFNLLSQEKFLNSMNDNLEQISPTPPETLQKVTPI